MNENSVFLLQHLHFLGQDEQNVKTLGIYSSREEAHAAVERFRLLPGFREAPNMANITAPGTSQGFYIDEFVVNQDGWAEGYMTT